MQFVEISPGSHTKMCKNTCQTVARVVSYEDRIIDYMELRGFDTDYSDFESLAVCASSINGLKYVFFDDDADVFAFVDENYLSDFQEILSVLDIEYYFAIMSWRK